MVEYLPYLDNRYIATAASLTGGNSLAAFVKMLQLWADSLEIRIPRSKIWARIIHLGQAEQKLRRMSGSSTVSSLPSGAQSPINKSQPGVQPGRFSMQSQIIFDAKNNIFLLPSILLKQFNCIVLDSSRSPTPSALQKASDEGASNLVHLYPPGLDGINSVRY